MTSEKATKLTLLYGLSFSVANVLTSLLVEAAALPILTLLPFTLWLISLGYLIKLNKQAALKPFGGFTKLKEKRTA